MRKQPRRGRPSPLKKRQGERSGAETKRPERAERSERAGGSAPHQPEGDRIWGRNPVLSLLENSPGRCLKVIISSGMAPGMTAALAGRCREANIPFSFADSHSLDRDTGGENHQGVVAIVTQSQIFSLEEAASLLPPPPQPALALLLDHVQDPHNLGAIIRSAEAAGASFVAMPRRRSALPTGIVAKTSAGASLRLPLVTVGNVALAALSLREECALWTVGLSAEGERSIYEAGLPARTLLVVGGEGSGLTKTTEKACDELLNIPIVGGVGSLNASIALAVAIFEWKRANPAMPNRGGELTSLA